VNLADLKAAELDLTDLRSDVDKAEGALMVLTKYTHPMNLASRQSYDEAGRAEARPDPARTRTT
jgi:hypothetical protein